MIHEILIPLLVVGLAELGDKTQIAIFCLSSKTKKTLHLLAGVILAFAVADGLAVIFGDLITKMIPTAYIKAGAGLVFIIFGILTLINREESEEKYDLKNPFMSGFSMILISEMGDKTQIAAGLFATEYNPLFVFIGVMSALTILSLMAIYVGKILEKRINRKKLSTIAGIVFILIGITTLMALL